MIGNLPTTVTIDGVELHIRTDYREILNILVAFNDVELSESEKWLVAMICFYVNVQDITESMQEEAIKKFMWFLNCGKAENQHKQSTKPTYNWEQDEQIIFSAINKVANTEVRSVPYMHWWTFMGYFNEIGEGTFSTIVAIRDKKNRGKKLELYEREFYENNIDMCKLNTVLSKEDKEFMDMINSITGGSDGRK